MKLINRNPTKRAVLAAAAVLAAGVLGFLPWCLVAQPSSSAPPKGAVANLIPLKLESSIPLAVQSAGFEWRDKTYCLVSLNSIEFELDKNNRLTAEIQGGTTELDNVDYDVSGAVFDAAGQMLGAARAQCKVQLFYPSTIISMAQTITLDFGVSLDYAHAAAFVVSISNRKVLTPDEWQK